MGDDDVALRLLGWRRQPGGEAGVNDRWADLHSNAHSTPEGATTFRKAVHLLSETPLEFRHGDADDENNERKDPLMVVKGYFRLVKCALEPAAGDAAGPLSDEEYVKLASDLLKRMGEALAGAIQDRRELVSSSEKAGEFPPSTTALVRCVKDGRSTRNAQAVLYYFQSILKHVHPHIRNRIRLLGPVYRCFCDVADAFVSLLETERSRMDEFVATFLPSVGWGALAGLKNDAAQLSKLWGECNGLFEQAAFHLLGLVDEALEKVRGALRGRDQSLPAPEKQAKILIFLFARVTSLVLISMRVQSSSGGEQAGRGGGASSGEPDVGRKLMTGLLQRLVKVCSLALRAQSNMDDATVDRSHAALLDMVVGLRPKAEQYLAKVLGDFESKNARAINVGLQCFVELPLSEDDALKGESLAKLHLMKHVMERLLANDPLLFPDATALTRFYESILFVEIPRCHHFFQGACSGLVSDIQSQTESMLSDLVRVLENVSFMLCHSEDGNWQEAMIRQHYLLVRWLAPASVKGNPATSPSSNHPMTNQLLLGMLERRTIASCAVDEQYSQQDATHFVSLLCGLVVHPQTEASHRRNIATLVVRLLSQSSDTVTATKENAATSLTVQMLMSNVKRAGIIKPTTQKRKRSRGATPAMFACEDVHTICWVLEALTKCATRSQTSMGSELSSEMRQLWGGILDKGSNACKSNETMFLLSLSIGALRGSSSIASFLQSFAYTPRNITSPTFIDGALAFLELQLGTKSHSSSHSARKALMQSLFVRLVGALSDCAGGNLSESQVKAMGTLLEKASTVTTDEPSVHDVGLQYDIVATASKMGTVAQPEFGHDSLQPLVQSIAQNMAQSGWYSIAPRISGLEHFVDALPASLRGLECIIQAMPAKSNVRLLFTSRKKGNMFGIVEGKEVDPTGDFTKEEARFLLTCCKSRVRNSFSIDEDKATMLIQSGAKMLVHRDEEGEMVAMVLVPSECPKPSSEILAEIGASKFDSHSIRSTCRVMFDR
ncbi:hypothetical protein ACHAXT_008355 [Thalassiosira profunda]